MAQFDIHRNPGPRTGATRPFLVVLQSPRFDRTSTRLVATLVLASVVPSSDFDRIGIMPGFEVEGRQVFLNPFEVTYVPIQRLGPPVASFAADEEARRRVQRALDEVLSHY